VRIARAGSGVIEHSLRDLEVAVALEDGKPCNATREIVEVGRAITGSLEDVLATVGEDRTEELPVGLGHATPGMSRSRYVAYIYTSHVMRAVYDQHERYRMAARRSIRLPMISGHVV
jgi:hypothetical protein